MRNSAYTQALLEKERHNSLLKEKEQAKEEAARKLMEMRESQYDELFERNHQRHSDAHDGLMKQMRKKQEF